ncbi:hypothetical protein A5806_002606 [Enterococcus faecium]|uniref:sortase domain-containing protein n=1 Tax=Enterococcus faecium TaxID=1352 RepID=UPI000B3E67EA|nr:sortase [Enterococcus faecium]OUZ27997.1 hypothetical protein A5806_002606 [Enterococcus faecium]
MIKRNKILWNPYVGVVIVFFIFIYFAYQGYQKEEITKKEDEAIENLEIHINVKNFHDDLATLNDISNGQLIDNQKKALDKRLTEEIAGELVFSSTGLSLPIFRGANIETLSLGVASTYYPEAEMGKGNYVLAGYNVKTPNALLSDANELSEGEKIILIDSTNKYQYEVSKIGQISNYKQAVQSKENNPFLSLPKEGEKPLLTLLDFQANNMKKCDVIQCELVNVEKINK